jgi:hypothetical protein
VLVVLDEPHDLVIVLAAVSRLDDEGVAKLHLAVALAVANAFALGVAVLRVDCKPPNA